MTRTNVIQAGLAVFALGLICYITFKSFGFESISSGIASEAILVFVVLLWTGSYLFRVLTGKMTFMEQRKRYRELYEKLTTEELTKLFDELPLEEQKRLTKELNNDQNNQIGTSSDS